MIRRFILKMIIKQIDQMIIKQINQKKQECIKQISVLTLLINEANECNNENYKNELEFGIKSQSELILECNSLYNILSHK